MNYWSTFKKFSSFVNCQTTVALRAIHNLCFHDLRIRHTLDYIIPPNMWLC